MRYLLCAIVAFLVACSSAPEATPVAADASADVAAAVDAPEVVALTTPYRFQFEVVGDNFRNITPPAGTVCHPINFACSGGHSQAQYASNGYAKTGAYLDGSDSTPMAYPNFPISPVTGYCSMSLLCTSFDWFGGGGGKSGDSDMMLSYGQPARMVTGSMLLWDFDSACWLDTLGHLSGPAENVYLDGSGWNWRLNVAGVSSLTAKAQCAWLGRSLQTFSVEWFHLYAGQDPQFSSMNFTDGECFVHHVKGNLDDGYVGWRHDNPNQAWKFEISGGVTESEGYCVHF